MRAHDAVEWLLTIIGLRTLKKVGAEMALHVLAYNMKRVMQILGSEGLIAAMRAWNAPALAQ